MSSITLTPLNAPAHDLLIEDAAMRVHQKSEDLRESIETLAFQVERLLRERQRIVETLSRFYTSEVSASSLQPVLDLAVTLNPALRGK